MLVSINPGGPNGGSATQYFVGDFDGTTFVLDKQFAEGLSTRAVVPSGKIFAGFEEKAYQGWQTEGEAFGKTPVQGSIGSQQKVSEFAGKSLVNSFTNGDEATGKLTSPAFTIENNYINMLVGGGKHPERTAVNLLVDNQVVKTATGNNSESLSWTSWNTKDLIGKQARIEIVDQEKGGWGHILVDQIMFADAPAIGRKDGIWLDYGRDNYAGVTWANIPDNDGRRIFMGWMSNWDYANVVPTQKWRSAMTLARTLTLENTAAGLRVVSRPVKELEKIRVASHKLPAADITNTLDISQNLKSGTSTISLDLELIDSQNKGFAIEFSNSKNQQLLVGFDAATKHYYVDRTKAGNDQFSTSFSSISYAPRLTSGNTFSINLIVDVASMELFADGGKTVMTEIFFPDEEFTHVRLISHGGKLTVSSGEVHQLDAAQSRAQ
jgi:beta-fructofuranosidase/levanase/fructan beta-fructosidase